MHVTAAVAYLVLLGVGLFSVVCAIHLPTGNDIHPPKPAPPLPKPHYNLRVSFLPHPDLPGEHLHEQSTTPVLAEQMKLFARNLVVAYLNQIRYDSFGWKVNNIGWENEFELHSTTLVQFILDDDIGGALCHPYCLGVVNVPVSTRRAPILGTLRPNAKTWEEVLKIHDARHRHSTR
ncbi:uncharacterized protein C8R40DRAFT_1165691 [Lentinula edodes]|uniref:uncharacterized protein n=1 Tax=Lentinula edodes TaxID=5353 RepID=UPI001E8CBB10|nr:uncharacterized protein C8R40DRAFT_1165691 [Lentinula edodes]KAH7880757.1 hypothetical protein C8R40DRAFT_1165691 [Lentinula edodes]KAJ3917842.1 hypothetical protein F5877DRAFT_67874 [Lentinula edodes]